MSETKIQFSAPELQLMCDAELILTKNKIIEKVKRLLEDVQGRMMNYRESNNELVKDALFQTPPKISKGENYGGLPYLILDYPRDFAQNEIFAMRTMFWWGRFFSSTLHISGDQINDRKHNLLQAFPLFQSNNYFININDDPWQHHFERDNYVPVTTLSKQEYIIIISNSKHIKIAAKWPLTEIHIAANTLFKSWKLLLHTALLIHLSDEKDLLPDDPKGGFGL